MPCISFFPSLSFPCLQSGGSSRPSLQSGQELRAGVWSASNKAGGPSVVGNFAPCAANTGIVKKKLEFYGDKTDQKEKAQVGIALFSSAPG